MPRNHLIQLRHGDAADWAAVDPVLKVGEPGIELDTGVSKVGNGVTPWSGLVPQQSAVDRIAQFYAADSWDQFTIHGISNITGTIDLSIESGGVGMATSVDDDGDDRRAFQLDGFHARNMEVGAEYWIDGNAQFGLLMRLGETSPNGLLSAAAPWQNVLFGANSNLLPGYWEWDLDTAAFFTNQGTGSLPAKEQEIRTATGDGATVTVSTFEPHLLTVLQGNQTAMDFGPYASNESFLVTVDDAHTFSFADTETFGPATTGTWKFINATMPDNVHRAMKARIVDEEITFKHWFPNYELEPSWNHPLRTFTYPVPASPASGETSFASSGGAGFLINHLGDTGREVRVSDFYARSLD